MLRLLLTWLLLLNYLLVVGVGLLVSRPPEPRYTAAHPYVHSRQCQQQHYLRLDCFEQCNGDQPKIRHQPTGTGLHYLAQLKGLDVHLLDGSRLRPANSAYRSQYRPVHQPGLVPTVRVGYGGMMERPPCRG